MSANSKQIAGTHYQNEMGLQHWDVSYDYGIGYLEARGAAYFSRAHKKGKQLEDLTKGLHFIEKLIEKESVSNKGPSGFVPMAVVTQFCNACEVGYNEMVVIMKLFQWRSPEDLLIAKTHAMLAIGAVK